MCNQCEKIKAEKIKEEKISKIRGHFEDILDILEIERDENSEGTPLRIAKMYVNEIFLNRNNDNIEELNEKMKVFPNTHKSNSIVKVDGIAFNSTCFTRTMTVRTKEGVKQICDVRVGDEVATLNEEGKLVYVKVLKKFKNKSKDILAVKTESGRRIECTREHPFFVKDKGWVEAEDLEIGDRLIQVDGRGIRDNLVWDFTINEGYSMGYVLGYICLGASSWRNQIRASSIKKHKLEEFLAHLKIAFNISAEIFKSRYNSNFTPDKRDSTYQVNIVSGYFMRYIKNVFGGDTRNKSFNFPHIVFNSYEMFKGFIEGTYSANGGVTDWDRNYIVRTTNKNFAEEYAKSLGEIPQKLNKSDENWSDIFGIYVPIDELKMKNSYVKRRFEKRLKNEKNIYIDPLLIYTRVVDIEELETINVNVYNLEVEKYNTYLVRDILVHNCSHHWCFFQGKASIEYIPDECLIGLSKFPRVVKYFSKKPQLQELLTHEIGEYLVNIIKPKYLKVTLIAEHTCVSCRGAENDCLTTTHFEYEKPLKDEV